MLSRLLHLPKSLLVCLLLHDFGHVLGDSPAYFNDQKFENGDYGPYPTQRFYSSDIVAPRVNILSTHPTCDDGSYTMLNPRGNRVPASARGPMILDARGNIVWAATGYRQTYDLMAQEYRGTQYLTFWSGNDAISGHGNGHYIMMDTSYKEIARVSAANGLWGDLHEFRFTNEGTALLTVYDVHAIDLSSLGGPGNGYIWDSIFQEIDIETGDAIFQWRASDHFNVLDSFQPLGDDGARDRPYDFFHIDSVEKDRLGNYLISSRYTSSISYIDGHTGELIWIMGGRRNQFVDLSDGQATNFEFQHDARWQDDYTAITLFANGEAPDQAAKAPRSRALKIRIDTSNSTHLKAELDKQYINALELSSLSQGNMQVLPNGNALVGYGHTSAFTEFSPNGVALCETHFGAKSHFGSGDVQSYRVMKFNWTATPDTEPSMAVISDSVFVSWNGATEVRQWVLETGDKRRTRDEIEWQVALNVEKKGFETQIDLPQSRGTYIRVVALDGQEKALGITRVIPIPQASKTANDQDNGINSWDEIRTSHALRFTVFCVTLICFGVTFSWAVNAFRRCWRAERYHGYVKVPMTEV